ncbi:hypothetical protein CC86DRAFT_406072 [Ophiobolus disseminans]|uniref:Uncharacterized protein n=1 Tax=Ophiobolus disseminans TaxID=1469910 RepID=A0A6A7A2P6_9PLEO|nr:hypothetical protein CC86DRAFT_406072 [Ophiobolus disseminans]
MAIVDLNCTSSTESPLAQHDNLNMPSSADLSSFSLQDRSRDDPPSPPPQPPPSPASWSRLSSLESLTPLTI